MVDDLIAFVADKAGCSVDEVTWYSWPQVFGSTSGPRGGISGQAVTTFQVYAFTAHGSKESVRQNTAEAYGDIGMASLWLRF